MTPAPHQHSSPGRPPSQKDRADSGDSSSRLISFLTAGITGFAVDAALLLVFTRILNWPVLSARLFSFWAAVGCTWALNRHYTFADLRQQQPGLLAEYLRYFLAQSIGGALNLAVFAMALWQWPTLRATPLLPLLCGSVAGLTFNYLAARHLAFTSNALQHNEIRREQSSHARSDAAREYEQHTGVSRSGARDSMNDRHDRQRSGMER